MIHDVTLADPLNPMSPPEIVLRVSAINDVVWVYIQKHDSDHDTDTFSTVAEISVSLPALREALDLIRHDVDRERQRPLEKPGRNERETLLAGQRVGLMPL